jgi:hypothetical protein
MRWRLRRAERALAEARRRREAYDIQDPDYGGLLLAQVEEERRIERQVEQLRSGIKSDAQFWDGSDRITPQNEQDL